MKCGDVMIECENIKNIQDHAKSLAGMLRVSHLVQCRDIHTKPASSMPGHMTRFSVCRLGAVVRKKQQRGNQTQK